MPARRPSRTTVAGLIALVVVVGLSVWLRWPGFTQGGFASHDVAGILYEGLVLQSGGLPYVDTLETKAPGSFYLALWMAGGTDIAALQVWANLWALASLGVVAGLAWRLWGPTASVVAAGLYALHDAHLDSMDANYVTWAQLPLVAGVGAALVAGSGGTRRRQIGWWVAAGVLAGLAVLLKRPAVSGVVTVGVLALVPGGVQRVGWRGRVLAAVAGGAAAFVPVVVHYAVAGELRALVDGYVLNPVGLRYVEEGGAGGVDGLTEGVLATVHVLVLPLALAMTALWPPAEPEARRQWVGLVVWTAATLACASIGLRFYKGYFLAVAAPLCLAAAAPWGLLGARVRLRGWVRGVLLVPALVLAMRQFVVLEHERALRAMPQDRGGRVIARVIRKDLRRGDRIWVWGWHLWDVYPFTGTLSGSRVYKAWGIITQSPDNTWRRPSTPSTFVDGEYAEMLIEDLRASRPVWIVLGSTVPRREFEALRELLREGYVLERPVRLGRVQFWHRRDRAEAARGREHR